MIIANERIIDVLMYSRAKIENTVAQTQTCAGPATALVPEIG